MILTKNQNANFLNQFLDYNFPIFLCTKHELVDVSPQFFSFKAFFPDSTAAGLYRNLSVKRCLLLLACINLRARCISLPFCVAADPP